MGVEIQIPIGMSGFSINLNNEAIVLASDQGVQEGDPVIIFFFNGKGDVLINRLHLRTNLDTTDIISLLNFVLSSNYFVYNNSVYKQIHGCAMGSPVSPVVANLCMEVIEEMAINTTPVPPKVWKRYVDDSFCIIKRNAVGSFHNSLNAIDQHISFTIRKTLESWHTASTSHADNNSRPLPNQYSILLKKNN